MLSQTPIPPLLYLNLFSLPCSSLTLLTSTLGTTTNWLVVRLVCAALRTKSFGTGLDIHRTQEGSSDQRIVLVSWLRDEAWWRESGRKIVWKFCVSGFTNLALFPMEMELIDVYAFRVLIYRKFILLMA